MLAYRWRRVDTDGAWGHPSPFRQASRLIVQRAMRWGPTFNLREVATNEVWGPNLRRAEFAMKLRRRMRAAKVGDTILIDTADHQGGQIAVRKVDIPDPVGERVVEAARSQIGITYTWGAAQPGGGFDCSGLTLWAVEDGTRGAVVLPHSAELQRQDWRVSEIARRYAKGGDLVFYHTGRLPSGQADHVGIYAGDGLVIDASSTLDRVVQRSVDSNPILSFGRVKGVNG